MKLCVSGVGLSLLLAVLPASAQERELLLADGQQLFIDNGCFSCHTVGGSGNATGPDLSHVGARYDEDGLAHAEVPAPHPRPGGTACRLSLLAALTPAPGLAGGRGLRRALG